MKEQDENFVDMSEDEEATAAPVMMSKKSKAEKKVTKAEKKAVKAEKKPESKKIAKKAVDANVKIEMKAPKETSERDFFPETGTRFPFGSARQAAFEVVLSEVKSGKNVKEIHAALAKVRKEHGSQFNLDPAYANFVFASHPEFFEVYGDGHVVLIGTPKVNAELAATAASKVKGAKEKISKAKDLRKTTKSADDVEAVVNSVEKKQKKAKKQDAVATEADAKPKSKKKAK